VATSDVLGEALFHGNLDFYLGRFPAGRDKRLFQARFIGPESISLLVRRGHPLLRAPERARERLPEFDWVLPFEGTLLRTTVEAFLTSRGMPLPSKILSTSSFMLTVMTVSRTNAIAPVSTSVARFFASEFGEPGAVVELPAGLEFEVEPYALISMAGRELTPAAQAMRDVLVTEIARGRPGW
jgi:DNA-binding transcriptional LysR family regulator